MGTPGSILPILCRPGIRRPRPWRCRPRSRWSAGRPGPSTTSAAGPTAGPGRRPSWASGWSRPAAGRTWAWVSALPPDAVDALPEAVGRRRVPGPLRRHRRRAHDQSTRPRRYPVRAATAFGVERARPVRGRGGPPGAGRGRGARAAARGQPRRLRRHGPRPSGGDERGRARPWPAPASTAPAPAAAAAAAPWSSSATAAPSTTSTASSADHPPYWRLIRRPWPPNQAPERGWGGAGPDDELGGDDHVALGGRARDQGRAGARPRGAPPRPRSWRTVVSGGTRKAASGVSSKPTTLTSSGTDRPCSCRARSTPSAVWSLAANTAVTVGVLGQGQARLRSRPAALQSPSTHRPAGAPSVPQGVGPSPLPVARRRPSPGRR